MESRMRVCPACRRLIVGVISRRALDPLVAAPGTSTRLHWPTMNGKLFLIYWDTWKMYVSILFFFFLFPLLCDLLLLLVLMVLGGGLSSSAANIAHLRVQ